MKTKFTIPLLLLAVAGNGVLAQNAMVDTSIGVIDTTNDQQIPLLIPVNRNGKIGYLDSVSKKIAIAPQFHLGLFFQEDCNLLSSESIEERKYGTEDYATVEIKEETMRIDKKGKIVYRYKQDELGKCTKLFIAPLYTSYEKNNRYGVRKRNRSGVFSASDIYIQPMYQYTYVLDSSDGENPMIVAINNDRFGIIDKNNNTILPFIYQDIKKNKSWRDANLFSVSMDGKHYYFVDKNGTDYK